MCGTETSAYFLSKHASSKGVQRAFQVSEGYVSADGKTLYLVKLELGTRVDLLVSITHPGQNHTDGFRRSLPHDMDLTGRGVGTQYHSGFGSVKCIPHVPRRVMLRHIEQSEIVFVTLHLTRKVDLKAHLGPDGIDLA